MRSQKEEKAFIETGKYLYRNPITGFLHRFGHRTVQRLIANKKGKIIDLGCGKGDHFPYMKERDFIGFDIDKEMLSLAREKYPQAQLCEGDVYSTPFNDATFDSAVAVGLLEHLSDLPRALFEIKRILKPKGELVVLLPIENSIYKLGRKITVKRFIERKYDVDYDELLEQEHVNRYKDIVKQLKNNFKIDKMVGIPFLVPIDSFNIFMIIKCKN